MARYTTRPTLLLLLITITLFLLCASLSAALPAPPHAPVIASLKSAAQDAVSPSRPASITGALVYKPYKPVSPSIPSAEEDEDDSDPEPALMLADVPEHLDANFPMSFAETLAHTADKRSVSCSQGVKLACNGAASTSCSGSQCKICCNGCCRSVTGESSDNFEACSLSHTLRMLTQYPRSSYGKLLQRQHARIPLQEGMRGAALTWPRTCPELISSARGTRDTLAIWSDLASLSLHYTKHGAALLDLFHFWPAFGDGPT